MPNWDLNKKVVYNDRKLRGISAAIGNLITAPFTQAQWTRVGNNYYTFGSNIVVNGGDTANPYTNYIYLADYPSCLQKQSVSITFTINAVGGSTANEGFWFGFQSVAQFYKSNVLIKFDTGSGANKGKITILQNANGTFNTLTSDTSMNISNGDQCSITFDINNDVLTITKRNITQALSPAALSWTTSLYTNSANSGIQNISCPAIGAINACNITITSYSWDSTQNKNVPYLCIGDSVTQGSYAGAAANSFPALLGYPTLAGGGDTTQDVLNNLWQIKLINPQNVLLEIGINDINNGVATATWQANFMNIITTLRNLGIKITVLTGLPNATLPAWINSTFPAIMVYDTAAVLDAGSNTMYTAYTTASHPNQYGHHAMYIRILYPTIQKETVRYVSRSIVMGAAPTTKAITAYDNLCVSLIASNYLTKMDVFVLCWNEDIILAVRNFPLNNLYALDASINGTIPFTAKSGFKGNGTTGYLDTNCRPSTQTSLTFAKNDNHFFIYIEENINENAVDMGQDDGTQSSWVASRYGNTTYIRDNNTASLSQASSDSSGLWYIERNNSANVDVYHNGVKTTLVGASSALVAANFRVGETSGAAPQPSTKKFSFYGIGKSGINPVTLKTYLDQYKLDIA